MKLRIYKDGVKYGKAYLNDTPAKIYHMADDRWYYGDFYNGATDNVPSHNHNMIFLYYRLMDSYLPVWYDGYKDSNGNQTSFSPNGNSASSFGFGQIVIDDESYVICPLTNKYIKVNNNRFRPHTYKSATADGSGVKYRVLKSGKYSICFSLHKNKYYDSKSSSYYWSYPHGLYNGIEYSYFYINNNKIYIPKNEITDNIGTKGSLTWMTFDLRAGDEICIATEDMNDSRVTDYFGNKYLGTCTPYAITCVAFKQKLSDLKDHYVLNLAGQLKIVLSKGEFFTYSFIYGNDKNTCFGFFESDNMMFSKLDTVKSYNSNYKTPLAGVDFDINTVSGEEKYNDNIVVPLLKSGYDVKFTAVETGTYYFCFTFYNGSFASDLNNGILGCNNQSTWKLEGITYYINGQIVTDFTGTNDMINEGDVVWAVVDMQTADQIKFNGTYCGNSALVGMMMIPE